MKKIGCRIVSMLGNTICNFTDESKELKVLKEIQVHDSRPTFIILGLELFDGNVEEILHEYQNDLTKKINFIPLELLGIDKKYGINDIIFNKDAFRIEEWFRITQDISFNPPYHKESYKLNKNDNILLSVPQKPTYDMLKTKLNKIWDPKNIKFFVEHGNAIVIIYPNVTGLRLIK